MEEDRTGAIRELIRKARGCVLRCLYPRSEEQRRLNRIVSHIQVQERTFEEIYRASVRALQRGETEVDAYLQRGGRNPIRFVTFVARPDATARRRIVAVQEELRESALEHYVYPPEDLHVTVFGRPINVEEDGRIPDDLRREVEETAESVFQEHAPVSIALKGLNLSTSTVFVQAFNADGTLEALRRDLRTRLRARGVEPGGRFPWGLSIAHLNIVRFARPEVEPLMEAIARMRALPLGSFAIHQVHFVRTDKYYSQDHTTLFRTFSLRTED